MQKTLVTSITKEIMESVDNPSDIREVYDMLGYLAPAIQRTFMDFEPDVPYHHMISMAASFQPHLFAHIENIAEYDILANTPRGFIYKQSFDAWLDNNKREGKYSASFPFIIQQAGKVLSLAYVLRAERSRRKAG